MTAGKRVIIGTDSVPLAQMVAGFVFECGRSNEVKVARSAKELEGLIADMPPDLVLIDSRSADSASHSVMGRVHSEFPSVPLAMFSFEAMTREEGARFLLFGARGCCNFRYDVDAQDTGIQRLLEGREYITPEISGVYEKMVADMESYRMSPREFEIYSLLIQGKKPSAIARMLGCSPATVKAHKRSIYRKCGVSSDCGLLRFAFDNGDARCLGAFNQE